ncbi:hypothetical protein C0Q70_20340 [Pomacea canaliculata]|uniref:Sorbitol dehydrogenase n=1 Tax=Pomacea canaliculata TaxID=400727 RepID=A0A2T7NF84_POMCA|nr:hypothetical protein C0Q70_20340 [Pomacea canaliculata]
MDTNLAAVIYGPGDLRMEEYPVRNPGPGEVQLSIRCCGLCRTDVHFRDFGLPQTADFEEGAMMEPLSVAVHAVNRAAVGLGDLVVVLGAGPIGLLALQVSRARGAAHVCVTDVNNERLKLALKLGASCIVQLESVETDAQVAARKVQETLGEAPDVALECSGAAFCLQTAILAVRMGGVVAAVGFGPESVDIPVMEAVVREVDIRGCVANNNCFAACVSMLENSQVKIKPIISHRFPLEEVPHALDVVRKRQGLKVIVNCGRDLVNGPQTP